MKRYPDNRRFINLSELYSAKIADSQGETVGCVADLLIDAGDNRLAYVNIRLKSGDSQVAKAVIVPWSAISLGGGAQPVLRIAVRRSTLKKLAQSKRQDPDL